MSAALIGSLVGFGGSIIPTIAEFFQKRQDQKFELQKMEKAAELRAAGYDHELKLYETKAGADEHARLIEHDIAMSKQSGFIGALQRSVRPVITYCFFGLFTVIEITLLMHAIEAGKDFYQSVQILWDDDTKAIFAAIMSFWFGDRALQKARERLK